MTFSIVASDRATGEWGVAVASKFLAVGAVVPWAIAGVGAVATQALANVTYGPLGLSMLGEGAAASAVVEALTATDEGRDHRQLGVVDGDGRAMAWTGRSCLAWAGSVLGEGFSCQGNILTGPEVVEAMAAAFRSTEGALVDRLLAALEGGDRAGGDRRGRQSASVLVVRQGGGYGGGSDRAVDLRVDDHPDPVTELHRLLAIHRLLMPRPEDLEFVPLDDRLTALVRAALEDSGHAVDDDLRSSLWTWVGRENLEERWSDDEAVIERGLLRHLGVR